MKLATYTSHRYMDVVLYPSSQSIEKRKGWNHKLTKNPESKKKATL
jgi:hypothetical protein